MPAQATEKDILSILSAQFHGDTVDSLDAYESAMEQFPELETQQLFARYCR